jgi:hypothetical protein
MRCWTAAMGALLAVTIAGAPSAAQQPIVTVDDDDITIRGCVRNTDVRHGIATNMLVWSRGDIMLAAATSLGSHPVGPAGIAGRVFYWLEDDDDLTKHVGQVVLVKGELKDFETGEVEIEREDDFFTEITLDLDGKKEKARVPTAWLRGTGADRDQKFEIAARRVNVKEVRVLGACTP